MTNHVPDRRRGSQGTVLLSSFAESLLSKFTDDDAHRLQVADSSLLQHTPCSLAISGGCPHPGGQSPPDVGKTYRFVFSRVRVLDIPTWG